MTTLLLQLVLLLAMTILLGVLIAMIELHITTQKRGTMTPKEFASVTAPSERRYLLRYWRFLLGWEHAPTIEPLDPDTACTLRGIARCAVVAHNHRGPARIHQFPPPEHKEN